MFRQSVAIIGSGISGLSAAWHLNPYFDITVFEKSDYLGGHSNTVDVQVENKIFPVDTGFIVFNPVNYPNLTALFDHLDVETIATDMSFAVSRNNGGFEYSGGDNAGLLAQPFNAVRPRFWSMVSGILRFYKEAAQYETEAGDLSLGKLLERHGYSRAFIEDHLAPMGAAIWSSDCTDILDYPARSFLSFFRNHGLVQLKDRPQWRTVVGGSREYVKKLSEPFADKVLTKSPVTSVKRKAGGVEVYLADGRVQQFDHIVLACHSDQALQLLSDPTSLEKETLSNIRYGKNKAVLHTDPSWMPKRHRAWASWNYLEPPKLSGTGGPAISYWMNKLQHLPVQTPVVVTLNPYDDVNPDHVLGAYDYDHPIFDQACHVARSKLMAYQGTRNTWFCGAYMGDGFHEDGIQSGLAIAEMISSVARPWHRPGQNARIGLPDEIVIRAAAQ